MHNPYKKIFPFIVISIILHGISCSGIFRASVDEGEIIEFETLAKGGYGGIEEPVNLVIKDNKKWDSLWSKVYKTRIPKPELPEVNFEEEMILAVFMGYYPTGGYSVSIENIIEKEERLIVEKKVVTPGPDDMVTNAITHPFHIVKTKKTDKEIVFCSKR